MLGGKMSRITLGIVGVFSILWGVWSLIPTWAVSDMTIPSWMAWFSVIVGIIVLIVAISDSKA